MRQVTDVVARSGEGGLESFRFKMSGGKTGDHVVSMMDGEWACSCMGFSTHEKCRHVLAGRHMVEQLNSAIGELAKGGFL